MFFKFNSIKKMFSQILLNYKEIVFKTFYKTKKKKFYQLRKVEKFF